MEQEIERDMPECYPENMTDEELLYWTRHPSDQYGREIDRREKLSFGDTVETPHGDIGKVVELDGKYEVHVVGKSDLGWFKVEDLIRVK